MFKVGDKVRLFDKHSWLNVHFPNMVVTEVRGTFVAFAYGNFGESSYTYSQHLELVSEPFTIENWSID